MQEGIKLTSYNESPTAPGGLTSSFLHHGMFVSFKDVTYTVQNGENRKARISLIKSVSGYLPSRELVALMGPSGSGKVLQYHARRTMAHLYTMVRIDFQMFTLSIDPIATVLCSFYVGKTTLLDVLAGRKTVGSVSGEVLFGGVQPSRMFLRRHTGYVEQFDTLIPILTVEEMLNYTAELKLDTSIPIEEKREKVEAIITTLSLQDCRKTIIGSEDCRGISGGELKRANIGISLISNPRVLFLDEPTTGLDSYTASEVMTTIKNLASDGITCCATIHSPTPYCFNLFDRLMLLLSGRVVYFGPNGPAAINYLQAVAGDIGTSFKFNPKAPAEWITDVTVAADRTNRSDELADAYLQSELKKHVDQELEFQLEQRKDLAPDIAATMAVTTETVVPTLYAFKVLFKYRIVKNYTSISFYTSRTLTYLFEIFVLVTAFWATARTVVPDNITNIVSVIYFFTVGPAFSHVEYVPEIILSRPLYFRERNDGLYTPLAYLMYLMVEECLLGVFLSIILCVILWFGVGLAGSWFMWCVSFFVSFTVGVSSAYFFSTISPNISYATALVPIYGFFCIFFCGFLIRVDDMGWWWRWYLYLNPSYYALSSQLGNFFSGDRNIEFLEGQTVTEYYAADWLPAWGFVGIQIIFAVVFTTLAWMGLAYKRTIER